MFYLDTSAIVKLVRWEPESDALRSWILSGVSVITSVLGRTETVRSAHRLNDCDDEILFSVLHTIPQIVLDVKIFEQAAILSPSTLRALDALHIATALTLSSDLSGMVTYDKRMQQACKHVDIAVITPGNDMQ